MAEIGGYGGNVTFAGNYVTAVKAWTINYEVAALDSTDFASVGEADYIRGVRKWSGTYTCSLDDTVVLIAPGLVGAAVFTASAARTFTGNILLTGNSFGAAVADLNEVTMSFEGKLGLAIG